jgi:hypothetical protein
MAMGAFFRDDFVQDAPNMAVPRYGVNSYSFFSTNLIRDSGFYSSLIFATNTVLNLIM